MNFFLIFILNDYVINFNNIIINKYNEILIIYFYMYYILKKKKKYYKAELIAIFDSPKITLTLFIYI